MTVIRGQDVGPKLEAEFAGTGIAHRQPRGGQSSSCRRVSALPDIRWVGRLLLIQPELRFCRIQLSPAPPAAKQSPDYHDCPDCQDEPDGHVRRLNLNCACESS